MNERTIKRMKLLATNYHKEVVLQHAMPVDASIVAESDEVPLVAVGVGSNSIAGQRQDYAIDVVAVAVVDGHRQLVVVVVVDRLELIVRHLVEH